MKHRTRPLSFLLALCLLFGAFLSNPSISLSSGPAENEQTAEAGVTYEDVLAGLADPYDFFGPLDESSVPEAVGYEKAIENLHVERMYEEEGDSLYNVIFKNADGSRTQYLFDHPVKYVTETGEIEDIRLDVVRDEQASGAYRTAANSAVTTFSQRLSDGISLRAGDVSLRLIPAGAPSASASAVSAARRLDADTVAYTYDDKTDYEYSLTYTGFKEDIVVHEYTGQTEYEFTIITNGLTLTDRDGSYYLTDGSGAVKATIGDIIIFTADERNNAFGTLTHETVRANQEYKLTIHIDPEYLLDEDTAYPIRIDPTIEITSAAGAIEDVTLNSLTGSDGDSWSLTVGKRATYGISRVLMKFPGLSLSAIPSADKITSATVELRDLMCEDESMMVYCYVFTGNTWTESTANWSNVNPNSYTDLLSSKLVSYSSGASLPTPHRYSFNITDAVKGWKTGNYTQSKGILFKTTASTENGSTYIKKTFSSYNRSSYKPSLTVTYTTDGSQTVANGTYYLNGKEGGGYLRYSSGEASAKSGLISSLGNSIRWEIQAVDGGYVLRSKSDTTKYLAVPSTSNSTLVTIETVSESTLPTRCIWTISNAVGGGCLIKNAYNGKYLYSYGTTLNTSSTLGTSGTSQYYSRVWRIISTSSYGDSSAYTFRELSGVFSFDSLRIDVGETKSPVVHTALSNVAWASISDFEYTYSATEHFRFNSATQIIGVSRGPAVYVTAKHKVTNRTTSFQVTINSNINTFLSKMSALYEVAYAYKQNNQTNAMEILFNFIRGQKYNDGFWPGVVGEWDENFLNYVQENNIDLYNYFICDPVHMSDENYSNYTIMVPDTQSSGFIDVLHMSATLNRLFYTGTTSYSGFPTFGILDEEVDALCGWAGDFQSLIRDYFLDGNNYGDESGVYNAFYPMIGNEAYYCGYSDIISDMDACNLYTLLSTESITTGAQFQAVFLNYYNGTSGNVAAKRFTNWIGSLSEEQLADKISPYCNDYSPYVLKWPILNSFTIYDYQQDAFTNAFTDYLIAQRDME